MANWDKTMQGLDKIYDNIADSLAHSNKTYNNIKVESAGIKQLVKANKDDDAKMKGLIAKIEAKFKILHKDVGEFVKAKAAKHADVQSALMDSYSEWRKVLKDTPTLK